ncbi:hypothetical protein ACPUEJ_01450 [Vibrio tubiashii]|uniref:hypothetical protein n=1 Tax=Vibrio tubiashii TaxID=29498 RepID=UPI003CE5284B
MSLETVSALVIGIFFSWYLSNTKNRLVKKEKRIQAKIERLESYSAKSGYKIVIRDSFHVICYALALVFGGNAISSLLPKFSEVSQEILNLVDLYASAFQLGAAFILLNHFFLLSKLNRIDEELDKLKKKLNAVKEKVKSH